MTEQISFQNAEYLSNVVTTFLVVERIGQVVPARRLNLGVLTVQIDIDCVEFLGLVVQVEEVFASFRILSFRQRLVYRLHRISKGSKLTHS